MLTRGQRLLIAVLQRTTGREVALRCRVHFTAVSQWQRGDTVPNASHRAALYVLYRIPPNAWARPREPRISEHT